LWPRIVAAYRGYADYQRRTEREIPVVVLVPR
jgi:F420H(2)-dependent quinone reductase